MRTTVRLDEALMLEVKRYAAARDKTSTKVVEEALREKLSLDGPPKPFKPKTVVGGLQPGINLDNNAETLELLEEGLDVLDVNVLLYAHKQDLPGHPEYAAWLAAVAASRQPFAVSSVAQSSFVHIATNPKLFSPPSTLEEALAFAVALREQPHCRVL